MPEEPKDRDKDARRKKREETRRGKVKGFFREHPTFFLTLMYVDLTGVGILYSLIFYRQFEINIFDFAEIGDFLLAAFKAPAVTFFVLLAQVLLVVLFTLILRPLLAEARRVLPRLLARNVMPPVLALLTFGLLGTSSPTEGAAALSAAQRERRRSMRLSPDALFSLIVYLIIATVLLGAVALTTTTAIIPLRLALSQAEAIKQDEQAQATVRYRKYSSQSTGQVKKSGLKLMGATQKVVFFYDANEERTIVIPQAQLVSIEVPDNSECKAHCPGPEGLR